MRFSHVLLDTVSEILRNQSCVYHSRIGFLSLSVPKTVLTNTKLLSTRASKAIHLSTMSSYSLVEKGNPDTLDYRIFYEDATGPISPFHDIPMLADAGKKVFNMVVEVPRWTNAKMEIATKEPLNPIKQDIKKGKLRYVHNCFPHHGYIWNYGAIPQTWENPAYVDESTGCVGDNDPIDVCEIGYKVAKRGEVLQVKVLGTFALIDEGETDWKILAIDVNDPLANELNDVEDIEKHLPGLLKATNEWFRIYKIPDGKPENKFAFDGETKNREFAENVIDETHKHWKELINGATDKKDLDLTNVTVEGSPFQQEQINSQAIVDKVPAANGTGPVDPIVDKWHFVSLK